ncbi:MAG: YihY/virulence factor BrkB family protein, partial [Actinomycetota bacterium]|nr:YihY/virulence factor BrkB family protein [Actinomycetota bacterium]
MRKRHPWLDHAVRAWSHFGDRRGNELAGAVTYFGFLSFFPLLAVTFAVVGFLAAYYPGVEQQVTQALATYLPGLVGNGENQISVAEIQGARRAAAGVGALGLVYAGLGWVDGLREALRQLFILPPRQGNIVVKKLADLLVLVLLGGGALVALAVSSLASAATRVVLEAVGLADSPVAEWLFRGLAPLLSIGVTTVLLLVIFTRLPGRAIPWREALEGAVLGAVGIQILMLLAGYLLRGTTENPVYGAFAVVVGLLVWLNFVSRVVLLAAAWAATDKRVPPRTDAEEKSPAIGTGGGTASGRGEAASDAGGSGGRRSGAGVP